MKPSLKLSLFLVAAGSVALISHSASAQSYRYPAPDPVYQDHRHPSPQVSDMISQLRGNSHSSRERSNLIDRSIKLNQSAMPKGCSVCESNRNAQSGAYASPAATRHGFQGQASDNFSYRVDSSAQLCTNEIKFLKNSTLLADECSHRYLQNLAYALMDPALRHDRFVVEGHASAEGSYATNQTLSQRRANAIFDFLVRQGVPPSRLLSVGHGEAQARYSSRAPEYQRSTDRRVIVFKLAH